MTRLFSLLMKFLKPLIALHRLLRIGKFENNWVNGDVKKNIRLRDEAISGYLISSSIENLNELRKAKNRLTKSIRNSKRDFRDKYGNFKGKAKSVFEAYNHFCKDEKNEIELDVEQFNAFFRIHWIKISRELQY